MNGDTYPPELRDLGLDATLPLPLYGQVAVTLRYRISSGALAPGTRLPALREASQLWGVNLHTVRKAYLQLQEAGMVEVRGTAGAFVAPEAGLDSEEPVKAFVEEIVAQARQRFGLSPDEVARKIGALAPRTGTPVTHVIECSQTLADCLASQLRKRSGEEVQAHDLSDLSAVGPGRILGTHFHYKDIRRALPDRIADLHFVSIAPARHSLEQVLERARSRGADRVVLCEQDATMAPALAADVRAALGTGVELRVEVLDDPGSLIDQGVPVLFSPRSWERLTESQRAHPDAVLLEFAIPERDLERLGEGD